MEPKGKKIKLKVPDLKIRVNLWIHNAGEGLGIRIIYNGDWGFGGDLEDHLDQALEEYLMPKYSEGSRIEEIHPKCDGALIKTITRLQEKLEQMKEKLSK